MIEKRLKDLDIKKTELANYLQISRPTMYKYIESYNGGNKKDINSSVKKLFDYIENNPLIGKRNVINYILSEMASVQNVESSDINIVIKPIKEYITNNPNSEKTQFIKKCSESTKYDIAIHYLTEVAQLLNKKKLTDEDKKIIIPYQNIIDIYTKNNKEEK